MRLDDAGAARSAANRHRPEGVQDLSRGPRALPPKPRGARRDRRLLSLPWRLVFGAWLDAQRRPALRGDGSRVRHRGGRPSAPPAGAAEPLGRALLPNARAVGAPWRAARVPGARPPVESPIRRKMGSWGEVALRSRRGPARSPPLRGEGRGGWHPARSPSRVRPLRLIHLRRRHLEDGGQRGVPTSRDRPSCPTLHRRRTLRDRKQRGVPASAGL